MLSLEDVQLQFWSKNVDDSIVAEMPTHALGDVVRTAYRDIFRQAVADGTAKPMFVSYLLLPLLLTALWLSIPHTRRSWLYATRWLVVALVVGSNVYHLRYVSSTNFACMFSAGMSSTWTTMLSMNVLVWTRPQFDAARTIRVAKPSPKTGHEDDTKETKHAVQNGGCMQEFKGQDQLDTAAAATAAAATPGSMEKEGKEEFDYVWQPYPAHESFLQRFGWSIDLILCFRGAGWNWCAAPMPRPALPQEIRPGDKVDMDSIPRATRQGYTRCLTEAEFIRDRLRKVFGYYLLLDFFSVTMMSDPFFILGSDHFRYQLPPHLRALPSWALLSYRECSTILAIMSAIECILSTSDLVQYWLIRRFFPSRGGLWLYASTFGSFQQVLDRGLAGLWGAFWHQTFRVQFLAPVTYLLREGYLSKGSWLTTVVGMAVTFFNSGLLHASGSVTAIPPTKPWRSIAFFMLQPVGIFVQRGAVRLIRPLMPNPPRTLSRMVNFLFVFIWLSLTAPMFLNEFASTGVWMFEPIPISPLRLLGLGQSGDNWWRWDRDIFLKYYVGEKWWQSGIAL